jgi:hypothetical protein
MRTRTLYGGFRRNVEILEVFALKGHGFSFEPALSEVEECRPAFPKHCPTLAAEGWF